VRRLPLVLLAVSALTAGVAAQGSRWRQIGTTSSGNPVFLDPRSVTTKDSIITATLRVTFNEPVRMPAGSVRSNRVVALFDCAKKQVAVKESVFYADAGMSAVVERRAPRQPGFGPPFRSNFSGVALDHLCAKPAAPANAKAPPAAGAKAPPAPAAPAKRPPRREE